MSLTLYCEAKTMEDAKDYIQLKCEIDGWSVLMPPHPMPVGVPCGTGIILSIVGFSFILHKFCTQIEGSNHEII